MKKNKNKQNINRGNVLDNEAKEIAEHLITEALRNNERKEINEGLTGAKFGVFTETDYNDSYQSNNNFDSQELSPITLNEKPSYDSFDEPKQEINTEQKESFKEKPEDIIQEKPKKKTNILMIIMILISLGVLGFIGYISLAPVLKPDDTNITIETELPIPAPTIEQDNTETTIVDAQLAKARIKINDNSEVTVNKTLANINEFNKAIVSYHKDIIIECKTYINNTNYDIESVMKLLNSAIRKDIDNLRGYENEFTTFNGQEIYATIRSRLENLYMYTETFKNSNDANKAVNISNGFIENENKLNNTLNDELERYLVDNNVSYTKTEDFISYIPIDHITVESTIVPTESPEGTTVPEPIVTEQPTVTAQPE